MQESILNFRDIYDRGMRERQVDLLVKEMGDVLWYIANLSKELELDLLPFFDLNEDMSGVRHLDSRQNAALTLGVAQGKIQERLKKAERDRGGALGTQDKVSIKASLVSAMRALCALCVEFNVTLIDRDWETPNVRAAF